jgi:polar amino acid transport system substrate-binding protein
MWRLFLSVVLLIAATPALASQGEVETGGPLRVVVADCPPFVMTEGGRHAGLAVHLWEQVAEELGLTWDYEARPLGAMLESISDTPTPGTMDVGISCISVTAEREKRIDFSHSFNETHTAIAVRETSLGSAVLGFMTHPSVWKAFLIIVAAAALIGLVFFLLEHKNNKKLFSDPSALGRTVETMIIGLLFVTNGPIRFYRFKRLSSRVLATLLALSGTVLIAAVTAVLASSFTVQTLQSEVRNLDDLRRLRVGTLSGSTSSAFLEAQGVVHQLRPDLDSLVRDLDAGELDAVVSDAAFLQYRIRKGQEQGAFQELTVLPVELQAQNYAFALMEGSPLREEINRALLTVRKQPEWRDLVTRYLGE